MLRFARMDGFHKFADLTKKEYIRVVQCRPVLCSEWIILNSGVSCAKKSLVCARPIGDLCFCWLRKMRERDLKLECINYQFPLSLGRIE